MVGTSGDASVEAKLRQEMATHEDVVQVDVPDTWDNLGIKSVAAAAWVEAIWGGRYK